MPMRRVAAITVASALLLLGCASPDPVLYTIAPVPGPVVSGAPKVVLLREVALARYLERDQIVRSSENYRLDVRANDWWGEPVGAMLGRILVEELGQRLPGSSVYGENGAVSVRPNATIELNVQRMDGDASGAVVLTAQAAVRFAGRSGSIARDFRIAVPAASPGAAGEVAAISAAIGRLADGLAALLVS